MIRISMPGRMPPPIIMDDDDDDDEIPQEIMDLIKMTSTLSQRSNSISMMPMQPRITIRKIEPHEKKAETVPNDHAIQIVDQPRHEESHEEIMARMNKLGEEIGEKHENRRDYNP
jgi:hypothetical protein